MGGLLIGLTSGLSSAAFAIVGKVFTKRMFEKLLASILISLINKVTAMTSNTLDDKAVKPIIAELEKIK